MIGALNVRMKCARGDRVRLRTMLVLASNFPNLTAIFWGFLAAISLPGITLAGIALTLQGRQRRWLLITSSLLVVVPVVFFMFLYYVGLGE